MPGDTFPRKIEGILWYGLSGTCLVGAIYESVHEGDIAGGLALGFSAGIFYGFGKWELEDDDLY